MKETNIEWTRSTFNAWWGCTKISPACQNCYASTFSHRWGNDLWGPDKPRKFFGDKHWNQPLKWNEQAAKTGEPWRVLCGSMCDVCEDREDLLEPRARLMRLIEATPALTWMLLTKRPENFHKFFGRRWDSGGWPKNVWAMTTVENQEQANKRLPHLCSVPTVVRGVSMEPLLEEVTLQGYKNGISYNWFATTGITWVITGAESGAGARLTHLDWFRNIRDQCNKSGIPYLHKQNGEWIPIDKPWDQDNPALKSEKEQWLNLAGGQGFHGEEVYRMRRIGTKKSGRKLDGKLHDGYPDAK